LLFILLVSGSSQIRIFSIPDPKFYIPDLGSASKNLSILTQKIVSKLFGTIIRVVYPGSRILVFYPSRIPDPGVKKAPDPGSGSATLVPTDRIQIRVTTPVSALVLLMKGYLPIRACLVFSGLLYFWVVLDFLLGKKYIYFVAGNGCGG
jgi:hypothetical protein